MAVKAYDAFCIANDEMVFMPTPQNMHQCSSECDFFQVSQFVSVCKLSRHVHNCTARCQTLECEGEMLCGITKVKLGERHVNCYWDETQTFTPKSSSQKKLSANEKIKIILEQLNCIFYGSQRKKLETKSNLQGYKKQRQNANKEARSKKLLRTNWHPYFFLFIKHCKRNLRKLPSPRLLKNLASNIHSFWVLIFGSSTFHIRKVAIFVSCCLSELVDGNLPIFPKIAWLEKCFISHPVNIVATICLGVASRSTSTMLHYIQTYIKMNHPNTTFPLDLSTNI